MQKSRIRSVFILLIVAILAALVFAGIVGIGVGDAYWAGMTVDTMTPRTISYYDLDPSDRGLVVVEAKGRAEKAGIEEGDLITRMNGMKITDIDSFLDAARAAEKSNDVVIEVKRDVRPMSFRLSGFNSGSNGNMQPVGLGPFPADSYFPVGGINTQLNSNGANGPLQSLRIPTEGLWLGMEIESVTPGGIRELNLPMNQTGIIVDSAPVGSVAEKAGLKNGDVITAINGQMIVNMADYIRATNNQKITSADLDIFRNGKLYYLTVPSETSVPGQLTPIILNAVMPHEYRGVCVRCHQIVDKKNRADLPLTSQTGNFFSQVYSGLPTPAQQNAAHKVLVEGHWLGMELIPITPELAREYRLPNGADGLLVDEVTLEAAESGLLAGDVLQSINGYPIKTLEDFADATRRVESLKVANLGVLRNGRPLIIKLRSSWQKLGVSQNEAAQPIQPGALSPHRDRGRACTDCHIIMKNGGQLPTDAGDILPNPQPITKNAKAPHSYRGKCNTCHIIK